MSRTMLLKDFDLEGLFESSESGKVNISEQVYFCILKEIFLNECKEGSRITEAQIAEKLGVSNGPVREAFGRLRTDGWIETIPNMGSFVVNYQDRVKFRSLSIDRSIIEAGCSAKLAEIANYRQLAGLEEIVNAIDAALANEDSSSYRDADLQFHSKVVSSIAGERLFNLWLHSTLQWFAFGYMPRTASEYLNNGVDVQMKEASHRSLFEAIASRDVNTTRELFEKHLNYSFERIPT